MVGPHSNQAWLVSLLVLGVTEPLNTAVEEVTLVAASVVTGQSPATGVKVTDKLWAGPAFSTVPAAGV